MSAMSSLLAALASWDYGDTGAFFDIPAPQYPAGLGRGPPAAAPPQLELLTIPTEDVSDTRVVSRAPAPVPLTSTLMVVQTPVSQLVPKTFSADELSRPPPAALAVEHAETAETLAALAARKRAELRGRLDLQPSASGLRVVEMNSQATGLTRQVAIAEVRRDPFDPKTNKVEKKQQTAMPAAGGPLIRSPTKRPADVGGFPIEEESLRLPGVVMQWANPRGKIIDLARREAVDGTKLRRNVPLAPVHAASRSALLNAEKDVAEEARARAAAERQFQEEQMKAEHERVERIAREAVQAQQGSVRSRVTTAANEAPAQSREERQLRRQEELEMRERKREEVAKQRRLARMASRIGVSVDELNENETLRRQVLEVAPVTANGEIDPRLVYAKGSRHTVADTGEESVSGMYTGGSVFGDGTTLTGTVDPKAVAEEMKRQEEHKASTNEQQQQDDRPLLLDEYEDDDAFGVNALLKKGGA